MNLYKKPVQERQYDEKVMDLAIPAGTVGYFYSDV
jgi:hypothetical protein